MLDTILDTSVPPDGVIDQWFVLQTAEPVLTPVMIHLQQALVVSTSRTLRVSTSEHRYELLIDDPDTPAEVITTRIVGIGLAHNRGGKGPHISDQLDRRGRVVPTCDWCRQQESEAADGTDG